MRSNSASLLNLHRYLSSRSRELANIPKITRLRPAVTISRETGAGAVTIGSKLAQVLEKRETPDMSPWAVFDKNLAEKVAEDHGMPAPFAKYMPESKGNELEFYLGELLGLHPSADEMVEMTNATISKLAMAGNAILVGRGGNLVTSDLRNTVHLRLVAPVEQRIRRVETFYELSRSEAAKVVRQKDNERRSYVKKHFDKDIEDPHLYHLTLNTGWMSDDEVVELVADWVVARMRQP